MGLFTDIFYKFRGQLFKRYCTNCGAAKKESFKDGTGFVHESCPVCGDRNCENLWMLIRNRML